MTRSILALCLSVPVMISIGGAADKTSSAPAPKSPPVPTGRMAVAARRNENVPIYQIDNNALQELNKRLGSTITVVTDAPVELTHYAREVGRPAGGSILLPKSPLLAGWHGEAFANHQNSILNSRTFFQVGGVKPSRQNQYGGRITGDASALGWLTGGFAQQKIRGMVNGNVLVPLASERTPLATDPAVRTVVQRFLNAFPDELPNRLDFDPRALNTNAPQRIDAISGDLRLDRDLAGGRISLFHAIGRQHVDAFQLVAGQNPDTDIHTYRSRITFRRDFSAATLLEAGLGLVRTRSLLTSEPNAVGPRVRFGFQIQELGPDSQFPIDRTQNSFQSNVVVRHVTGGGRHNLTFGGDAAQLRLYGIESSDLRGYVQFTNNFGLSAIDNFLLGRPSKYEVTIGEIYRAFRNWRAALFASDQWRVSSRLQFTYGIRYGLETTPVEAQGRDRLPYSCDCNNVSPMLSLAYQLGRGWTGRAAYRVSFGEIFPVTYQQIRNNLPLVRKLQIQNPDLLDPLRGLDLSGDGRYSPTVITPDLVTPYVHQAALSLERPFAGGWVLRVGYTGSRTLKPFNPYVTNRADRVEGIPTTLDTVDLRRPDPRLYEVFQIANGGMAHFHAGQVSLDLPYKYGLALNLAYTFSKATDDGVDFVSTAAGDDLNKGRSQSQYESFADRRGLSNFDTPHSLLVSYSYDLPRPAAQGSWRSWIVNDWQISGTILSRSGTPLTLYVGSDSPGFGNVDGSPSDRPNILDPSILGRTISHPDVAPLILSRDRFSYIDRETDRGNLGRNSFRKAAIHNMNVAITKRWRVPHRNESSLLLRGEAYNLTNTPQFDEPQRNYSSPSFGRITNTLNDGRVLQLGLRLIL